MSKVFEALERLAMPDELHIKECKKLGIGLTEDYEVVEQALLKAQEQEKVLNEALKLNSEWAEELDYYKDLQESKQYLKWEDLEFDDEWKYQEVKLNGAKYTIKYKCGFNFFDNYYKVVKIYNQDKRKQLLKIYNNDKFFNYLHLERVEE